MADQTPAELLVVDDERELADLFATWLSETYNVQTAYDGAAALDRLGESTDVVLLDRRMPDLSGDEVLTEIRERDLDCRVAMVTAVDPDVDVLEMGFDDYVTKPVTSDILHDLVETLLARKQHGETLRRYYRLVSKRATLESNLDVKVASDPEYEDLLAEIESLEADLSDQERGFADDDFVAQYHRIAQRAATAGQHDPDEADSDR